MAQVKNSSQTRLPGSQWSRVVASVPLLVEHIVASFRRGICKIDCPVENRYYVSLQGGSGPYSSQHSPEQTCLSSQTSIFPLRSLSKARKASLQPSISSWVRTILARPATSVNAFCVLDKYDQKLILVPIPRVLSKTFHKRLFYGTLRTCCINPTACNGGLWSDSKLQLVH